MAHVVSAFQPLSHALPDVLAAAGLDQIIVRAQAQAFDSGLQAGVPGQQDHNRIRRLFLDPGQQLDPGQARHTDVGQNDVIVLTLHHFERFFPRSGRVDLIADALQCLADGVADGALVVDHQYISIFSIRHDQLRPY